MCEEFVRAPSTEDEWTGISEQFARLWNFPNCVGAIDGKHIVIQAPANAGSTFYNYKGTRSIILLAVCDAHYRFALVDIGDAGHHSDGGVFSSSAFGQAIESESLAIPPPRGLPGTSTVVPFVLVGGEAFPLRTNLMQPFPGRYPPESEAVFNYRLSKARRIIEIALAFLLQGGESSGGQ